MHVVIQNVWKPVLRGTLPIAWRLESWGSAVHCGVAQAVDVAQAPWGLGCSPTCREVFWCAHNPRYFHLHVLIPAYKTKFSHWKFVEILILQIFTRFPKCHLTACASGIHSPLSPYCFLYIILPILISAERPSFCKWLVPVASFSKEASKWPSPSWWNCQVLAAVKVISNVSRTVAVNRKVPKACFKYLAKSPTHGVIS